MTDAPDPGRVGSSGEVDKAALRALVCEAVRADLAILQRTHADALEGATHEDARQESDKDMRATEASYIARGQAKRVLELTEDLAALEGFTLRAFTADDPVALGALVTVALPSGAVAYFVAPAAGGLRVHHAGLDLRVVTPRSPLGRALLGRRVEDPVSWQTPHGEVEGSLASIA